MTMGLNGETIFKVNDLKVGQVPGDEYGYRRFALWVTVDIRMEHITKPAQTITHETIAEYDDFAMAAAVWRPNMSDHAGGDRGGVLRELTTFVPGFDAGKAAQLADLGKRWHLNGMHAGCAHQPAGVRAVDYRSVAPCPETGYKYGHAWLVEPLPAGFMATLRALLPPPS